MNWSYTVQNPRLQYSNWLTREALLSGQPLLSSQLAQSWGWPLNRGLTVYGFQNESNCFLPVSWGFTVMSTSCITSGFRWHHHKILQDKMRFNTHRTACSKVQIGSESRVHSTASHHTRTRGRSHQVILIIMSLLIPIKEKYVGGGGGGGGGGGTELACGSWTLESLAYIPDYVCYSRLDTENPCPDKCFAN